MADSDRSPSKSSDNAAVAEAGPPETSDSCNNNGDTNVGQAKRPAWNKLSNGVVEAATVMGASWPALSESARASPRSSSDSLKALSDGSVSPSQAPLIASSPQKQTTNNPNHNSTPNHTVPVRQKSMKRISGPTNNGGPAAPSEIPHNASDKTPAPAVVPDSSRDFAHKTNNWEGGPRPHVGNDHPRARRGIGGGPHPRGDGFYNNNHGNRRDPERPNYDWNPNRSFNGRDPHMQQHPRVAARNFIRPPPLSTTFIPPPPVRPLGNPVSFHEMPSPGYYTAPHPDAFRGMPFVAHVPTPAMYFTAPDPQLRTTLMKQIDYYFSSENLCKDIYLRRNMDEQGWVTISLIANFNRVKQLTNDVQFILDAMRSSSVVEVMGEKIRKRGDWMQWPLPPVTPNANALAARMQNVGLEGAASHNSMRGSSPDAPTDGVLSRSSSGDSGSPLQAAVPGGTSNGEGITQASVRVG
ncbi:la-related protein 1C-like isoform X2 [Magnolia sinica]|nr:la-related protein 1C-like isoform X2 [Magnolia sinica]